MAMSRAAIAAVRFALALAAGALFACQEEPPEEEPLPPSIDADESDRRPDNPGCVALPKPPPPGRLRLERAFEEALASGTKLVQAIDLVEHPGEPGTWFVALQSGRVIRFDEGAEGASEVVLDVAKRLELKSSESGLVGFTLHPDFADNGEAFAVYSTDAPAVGFASRLSRFVLGSDGRFSLDDEEVLLDVAQRDAAHTGNHTAFGNDGYLYYVLGDDRRTDVHAQDRNTLQGKVLRIDVDARDEDRGTPYAIPPDNPFADGGGAPEVFAYGLRNPWRVTVDPKSGAVFAGDVGQDRREEINVIVAGGNYGWPMREGTTCFREDPCDGEDVLDPAAEVVHPAAHSVVAGFPYLRDDIEGLTGRYLFADFISGSLFSVDLTDPTHELQRELDGEFNVVSFARGHDDRLYVLRYETEGSEGGIYRVVPNDPGPSDFPTRLSETGCVDMDDPTEPLEGLVAYAPISPLYSDGADKARLLAMPDRGRIAVLEDGDFGFPNGTVLVKHFGFEGQLIETRLLMRHDDEWAGYSYRWDAEQQDAELLPGALDTTVAGGRAWHFPSRSECNTCHTRAAGRTLGLEVAQLDHAGSGQDNQLRYLLEHDYLDPALTRLSDVRMGIEPLVDPSSDAPLSQRARAYLHSNCANCHRAGGTGRGDIDLRYSATWSQLNACDETPRTGKIWDTGNWGAQRIIAPGRKQDSVLWMRMGLEGHFQMPPLGIKTVDAFGLMLVGEWIDSLADCAAP